MDTKNTLLTVLDVAKIMRVSPLTIRRWSRDKKFPAPVRIGSTIRWRTRDIERFITSRIVDADTSTANDEG